MAFRLPSLQFEYTLIFSGDPSLKLPELPIGDGLEAERVEVQKERDRLIGVAQETGRWDHLLVAGDDPTIWKMRSIHTDLVWLQGQATRGRFTPAEVAELGFRCAVTGIENFAGLRVDWDIVDGRTLLAKSTVDAIKAVGIDIGRPTLGHHIIRELGDIALTRAAEGISPKR